MNFCDIRSISSFQLTNFNNVSPVSGWYWVHVILDDFSSLNLHFWLGRRIVWLDIIFCHKNAYKVFVFSSKTSAHLNLNIILFVFSLEKQPTYRMFYKFTQYSEFLHLNRCLWSSTRYPGLLIRLWSRELYSVVKLRRLTCFSRAVATTGPEVVAPDFSNCLWRRQFGAIFSTNGILCRRLFRHQDLHRLTMVSSLHLQKINRRILICFILERRRIQNVFTHLRKFNNAQYF